MTTPARDGQHDFDFEFGAWSTQLSRLVSPLSGSDEWAAYEGTSVVRPIWDGLANLVELDVTGETGGIQALSLRLYDPPTGQWSLHSASARGGGISPPAIGRFVDGRAEFVSEETFDGRPILVRLVISDVTADSCRFEQAFSADGGKTWEVNWIAVDSLIPDVGCHVRAPR